MNTDVTGPDGEVIGYYFWDGLSKCWIAVRADGTRASAQHAFQAVRFIRGAPE